MLITVNQPGADAVDAIAHASRTQVQAEEGVNELHNASSTNPVDRAETGYGPIYSWFKLALCHIRRKLSAGLMAAGAAKFVAMMFDHARLDLRQLKSLVAQRCGRLLAAISKPSWATASLPASQRSSHPRVSIHLRSICI